MKYLSVTDRFCNFLLLFVLLWGSEKGKNLFPRPQSHTCPRLALRVLLEVLDLILSLVFLLVSSIFVLVVVELVLLNSRGYPPTAGNKSDNPATAEELLKIAQDSRQRNACLTYAKGGIRLVLKYLICG